MNDKIVSKLKSIIKEGVDYNQKRLDREALDILNKEYKKYSSKYFKLEKEFEVLDLNDDPRADLVRRELEAFEEKYGDLSARLEAATDNFNKKY